MKVPSGWELPDKILARLGLQTAGRQRAIAEDGHLLLVLHDPPGHDHSDRDGVFFWRTPEGEWKYSGRGNGIGCLREHLRLYRDIEDHLDDQYERASEAKDYFELLEKLAPLHRAARNQASALQAAREAVMGDRALIELRDEAGSIELAMELLYADTKNALDFDLARTAEEQARFSEQSARAGHRLNILAALFFPLTALTSFFGMNLPLGMDGATPLTTIVVSVIGCLLGAVMLVWVAGSHKSNGD